MRLRIRVAAGAATLLLLVAGASCSAASHSASSPSTATTVPPATTPATLALVTTTTTTRPPPTLPPPPPVVTGPGVAVGDSVLEDVQLYAPATLTSHGIAIDAAVGRQWAAGIAILTQLRVAGKLPAVVIVALGSNGRITSALFDQMMQACAGARRVVFMTVTGALIGNNPIITAGVARYRTAVLADWHTLAAAHPAWFGPDHVHVGPAGATALGNLLARLS